MKLNSLLKRTLLYFVCKSLPVVGKCIFVHFRLPYGSVSARLQLFALKWAYILSHGTCVCVVFVDHNSLIGATHSHP